MNERLVKVWRYNGQVRVCIPKGLAVLSGLDVSKWAGVSISEGVLVIRRVLEDDRDRSGSVLSSPDGLD